ncbi:MAG: NAD(P)H-dependent oxidoreductase subunit E [Bacillota bacterium]
MNIAELNNVKKSKLTLLTSVPGVFKINRSDKDLDKKYGRLDEIIARFGSGGQLIRILQEAQNIFGYLPEEVQTYIAGKTGIPVSEVNGVVTFYSLFHTEPSGRHSVNVCLGTACYVQGAKSIMEDFRRDLGLKDGDTSEDGLFTVKSTRCIGACGLAPVITVDEEVHGRVNRKDVTKILRRYSKLEEAAEKANDYKQERFTENREKAPAGP